MARRTSRSADAPSAADAPHPLLHRTEREILVAIGRDGPTARSPNLFLSESAVKPHIGRVLAKVAVRDGIQAVVLAYDLGPARPNDPDP